MEKIIKVHIADDHQILIDGVKAVLNIEPNIEVIGFSLNGIQVIEWFKENRADVLILDINMPELDGIGVLKKLQKNKKRPEIIVLSSYDDVKLVKEVLNMGALGFVPKKSAGEHIVNAVYNVAEGKQYFTEDVKEKMMQTLLHGQAKNEGSQDGVLISSLTNREVQVLKLVAQQYSTREIAEELHISESTVETHRKNLMKKVKVKNSVGLAIFALKNEVV
ncbi:MAG: response regulator transcription factor [Flavobacteriaceae bacterium]|nr:response regulator transcription factor [Flavobacteriaceae bacterium]